MYGIVLSALYKMLGYILTKVVVKFIVLFGVYWLVAALTSALVSSGLLPKASDLSGAFGGIPSAIWYFLDGFRITISARCNDC
jgi:hypothetical protein